MMFKLMFGAAAFALSTTPAAAAVQLAYFGNDDAAFEGATGYLATVLGAPVVNGNALVPLERAVGEVRIGTAGSRRAGLHTPSAGSGLPTPVGTGVERPLTNYTPVGGGSMAAWTSGVGKAFSIGRTGATLTFAFGNESWSETQSYFGDINSFSIRLRSQSTAASGNQLPFVANAISLTGLTYAHANGIQALADLSAADGALAINFFRGVAGDFTLSGTYTLTFADPVAGVSRGIGQSALASQIKLLQTAPIPEPAAWALMIAGFGAAGVALRRRTRVLAAA